MGDGDLSCRNGSNGLDDRWSARTWSLVAAVGVVRVLYLAVVPVDLVHDEAYYWDWSRHPAWGYYSKPPMVAWLVAMSTWLGGSSTFFVRLPAALLSTAGSVFAALLARRMYGAPAGFWAAALALFSPGNCVLSLVMTIDAPLLFAWSAALYGFWCILEHPRSLVAYLGCAVAVGFGCLSKQTMLGFLPLALLFLATSETDRHRLRDWRLWATAAAGLLCLTPVLLWNHQHDWVTIVHTSEHFAVEPVTFLRRIVRSLEFVASQMLVVSPITWGVLVGLWVMLLPGWRRWDRQRRYLLCFSAFPLFAVALLSFRQRVEANWPAPFYLAGFPLIAGVWGNPVDNVWSRWRRPAVRCGLAFSIATMLLPFLITGLGARGSRFDAAVRMWGWRDLALCVNARLRGLPQGTDTLLISDRRRGVASELAFYLPHRPEVFVFNDSGAVTSQYDVWGGPHVGHFGRDALILAEQKELPASLRSSFRHVAPLPDISVAVGNNRTHHYHVWLGKSLSSWPTHATAQRSRVLR